ncbi:MULTISPECIES: hypothetical protein [unclassified Streptomyces]|uniref:hypothetical protein n=1 Tax=unclassified Streptomyces TaxID=2593676 RepID=UPI001902E9F3|nr:MULTISPECIES: hypothetical protein [unclassified Streptomyces]MCU4747748.1 hypothetical protein [Streptomyces sp. G-5]QQN78374.1 hypothetical protein IPZ77_13665 [Streptomyces sp. XC 2026]
METTQREEDIYPLMAAVIIVGLLATGTITAIVGASLMRSVLERVIGTVGSTITGVIIALIAAVGLVMPSFAFIGGVHLLWNVLLPWGAIWTSLGVLGLLLTLAAGWHRERLPVTPP